MIRLVFDTFNALRGLDGPALRAYKQHVLGASRDRIPVPPLSLVASSTGSPNLEWFLEGGRRAAECLAEALSRQGAEIARLESILSFGCGCGRVERHLLSLTPAQIDGVDINARAIKWCQKNLGPARYRVCALEPPLAFNREAFNLVYGLSVLTHLPEASQHRWAEELCRVLRPGGYLLISLHGEAYQNEMSGQEQEVFRRHGFAVRYVRQAGSNRCAAFHSHSYVAERLFPEFDLCEFVPEGARGNPRQDLYLFQKPAGLSP